MNNFYEPRFINMHSQFMKDRLFFKMGGDSELKVLL